MPTHHSIVRAVRLMGARIRFPATVLLATLFVASPVAVTATLEIVGRQISERPGTNGPLREAREFQALMDQGQLWITSVSPAPGGGRYGFTDGCKAAVLIRDDVLMTILEWPPGSDGKMVGFGRTEGVSALANCDTGLASLVFLALRAERVFPELSGERRLAAPWDGGGYPGGLIKKADYRWSNPTRSGRELKGEITVSRELKARWKSSDLLSPAASIPEAMRQFEREVAGQPDGFRDAEFTMGNFIQVGGRSIPRSVEFIRHRPTLGARDASKRPPEGAEVLRLEVDRIRERDAEVTVLPVVAGKISVTDYRLFDRAAGIVSVSYETNRIDSFVIAPVARQRFHSDPRRAPRVNLDSSAPAGTTGRN